MTATFTNGAGGPITIGRVYGDCTFTYSGSSVSAGQNFRIDGQDCSVAGIIGDPYNVEMYIEYNVSSAGEVASHREYGILRGPME
jgi:hypothetical protein